MRLQEGRLGTAGEGQVDADLVRVGDVMPNAFVRLRGDALDGVGEELEDPVEIVRAPVVDGSAGDRFMAVPEIAWVVVAADERLHVERFADAA